jgi:hypothetical protein
MPAAFNPRVRPPAPQNKSTAQMPFILVSTILKTRTDFALFGRERASQPCELFNESILNFAKMVEA